MRFFEKLVVAYFFWATLYIWWGAIVCRSGLGWPTTKSVGYPNDGVWSG